MSNVKKADYSNTIFYKIQCKDPSVTDLYIGHTTDFVRRKYDHRNNCSNNNAHCHSCKLYTFIRDNNGWDNWDMTIIAFSNCDGLASAKKIEQQYFEEYKATLNSIEPSPKPKTKPLPKPSPKPKTKPLPKLIQKIKEEHKYSCDMCNYGCNYKSEYNRHLTTIKHITLSGCDNVNRKTKVISAYACCCNKVYKYRQGYYRHKKTCSYVEPISNNTKALKNGESTIVNCVTKVTCVYTCCCNKVYKYRQGYYRHKKTCSYVEPISNNIKTSNYGESTIVNIISQNEELIKLLTYRQ